ncbi:MAG: cell division protein ZapA, partial [Ottowia sp.]|nr:cell division protein ZapA [Ottowia sp.]
IKARDRIAVLAALNMAYELTDAPAAGAERAPASAPQPSSASSSAAAQAPALSVAEQATLGALLSRLDKALGDDGRLI